MSYVITLNGKDCNQSAINDIINILDFYKTDSSKRFSLNLENILDYEAGDYNLPSNWERIFKENIVFPSNQIGLGFKIND